MTETDLDAFSVAYKHLGAVMGKTIDSDLLMDAFRDTREFPLGLVEQALEDLRRSCRYFPRPAQIIAACRERAHVDSIDGGTIPSWVDHQGEQPKYFCDECQDTGFVLGLACDGYGSCQTPGCGKEARRGDPHTYTRKCACRATNPVLAYERAKLRRAPDEAR